MPKRKGAQVTIPDPIEDLGSLYRVSLATKELVEVLAGQRGDPGDRAVTYAEFRPPDRPKLAPAAQDEGEYVLVNGVWRLKSQSFDMTGLTVRDIQVPAWGPTQVRFSYNLFCNTATQLWARASVDGTTFPAGTTDWYWGGFTHNSTSGAFGNITWAGLGAMYLTGNIGATSVPATGELVFGLTKIAGQTFNGRGRGHTYDTNAIVHYDAVYYANVFVGASTLPLKTFRFGSSPVIAFASGKIVADWMA